MKSKERDSKGMKKEFWTAEKLLGLSAIIISLSTLFVMAYQTNLVRKQQYMSVYPHLDLTNFNSGSLNYKYVLTNEGVGPAFVKEIHVKEKNGQAHESLVAYVEGALSEEDSIAIHYSDLYAGRLIPAGEEIILFGLSDNSYLNSYNLPPNTVEGAETLRSLLNDESIMIEIVYESIYGERWSINNHSYSPTKH